MTGFRIFCRRTTGSGPPPDLQFGELAFSDADDSLHIGKADGSILSFSLVAAPPSSNWILATGAWNDSGAWDDSALWKDS